MRNFRIVTERLVHDLEQHLNVRATAESLSGDESLRSARNVIVNHVQHIFGVVHGPAFGERACDRESGELAAADRLMQQIKVFPHTRTQGLRGVERQICQHVQRLLHVVNTIRRDDFIEDRVTCAFQRGVHFGSRTCALHDCADGLNRTHAGKLCVVILVGRVHETDKHLSELLDGLGCEWQHLLRILANKRFQRRCQRFAVNLVHQFQQLVEQIRHGRLNKGTEILMANERLYGDSCLNSDGQFRIGQTFFVALESCSGGLGISERKILIRELLVHPAGSVAQESHRRTEIDQNVLR